MKIFPVQRLTAYLTSLKGNINRKAIVLSLFMTVLSYCFSNWEYPLFVETKLLQITSLFKNFVSGGLDTSETPDSIIFVDVSYDRELIKYIEDGNVKGEIDVTNRLKLEKFLQIIDTADYKAVILDVDFSKKYNTGKETSIADLLDQMDSIYIAKSDDILNPKLLKKAYWVDHYVNALDNSFSKVALTRNDTLSLPMKLFLDKSHMNFSNIWGILYFVDGGLARRCIYPDLYIGSKNVITYSLGQELLNESNDSLGYTPQDVRTLVKNKIVIIGSVKGELDNYNTYSGEYPGTIINANIYLSLWNGAYNYPVWLIVLQLLLYYLCGTQIFKSSKDSDQGYNSFTWMIKVSSFVWLHYTGILTLVCLLIYLLFGEAFDIIYSSTVLSIIHGFVKLLKYIRYE